MIRILLGPESSWITGQVIAVDGGYTLQSSPALAELMASIYGPERSQRRSGMDHANSVSGGLAE